MEHSDFKINECFYTGTGKWMCTDIGTRVITAVKYDELINSGVLNPPYAVAEVVFDEYDFGGCNQGEKHEQSTF